MNQETITIKQYLNNKGIPFKEIGKELVTNCLFDGCDDDSREGEAHLYFNSETSQYDCKKCGAKGNIFTLAKHLGDSEKDVFLSEFQKPAKTRARITPKFIEEMNLAIPDRIRGYLNGRGITDELISEYKLGWGKFYGKWWIVIPIPDTNSKYQFLKLRKDPDDRTNETKYKFYPTGSKAAIYGWESINSSVSPLVICEGEFDRLILQKFAIPAITSTAGAGTFKKEWLEYLKPFSEIYVAFDKDETGKRESEKLIETLEKELPEASIYKTTLPDRMTDSEDVSDYFNKYEGNPDEFIYQLSEWTAGVEPIDVSKFKPITSKELIEILELTIKKDEENKLVTLLCMISAYTENSQFNISFNAPSSTGKSFIPTEIAKLFPDRDIEELAQCSPTAFFHDFGEWDEERKLTVVDLSRKIIIFLDQPGNDLLARLRPILSHDKKEIMNKITDKNQKHGLRTKRVLIKGFPSVIFCSAGLKIDEQEGTRFILLSPETSQEKLREGITEKIKRETDSKAYKQWLESNPERKLLKQRIKAIAREKIGDIKIDNKERLNKVFFNDNKVLKPRYQRDVGRLMNIIKAFALLNLWFREREEDVLVASDEDIEEGIALWQKISESQEYNLPPFVYQIFQEVIMPIWNERDSDMNRDKLGLTRQEIIKKHYEIHNRPLQIWLLRMQIIPMLECAGLISQDKDPNDARKLLVYPTPPLTASSEGNNSEKDGGVSESTPNMLC